MDPNATLNRLIDAATTRDQDPQDILDAAEDLVDWIDRGGFLPDDPRKASV